MRRISHIKWLPVLLGVTIVGIAAFQIYWLYNTYDQERRNLEMRTNWMFRETVHSLQATKLKLNTDSSHVNQDPLRTVVTRPMGRNQKTTAMMNVLRERITDSLRQTSMPLDSLAQKIPRQDRLFRILYEMDAAQDSVKLSEVRAVYAQRLDSQNIHVSFVINRFERDRERRAFNEVTLGFLHPVTYQLEVQQAGLYLMRRIMAPIFLSLFIVGFTALSFILLYRNLRHQQRLTDIKNEFISNITHELKTPIATVSVAIEALRSFNASMDQQRTKEYLDISHNELQRLSLLVDKVLKLSIFETKEVDLKYERLNMRELVDEVTASMRLQFEKYRANVTVEQEGDTVLEGDRLHLVSVLFNLMDNALKYSNGKPQIDVLVKDAGGSVQLCVADNGIGIPKEYRDKVFDKFFRVPTGNLHNAKGYGLGLSYVAHVVEKHKGTIRVDSEEGTGSRFVITIPKQPA
ncbi:sensor histidine kinase [Paracnuella aquatica]|uniref:sensor histidine kinase n=1 Tax=Paracnuella aquatica TaxID=2268757 RepID=UPI000DEED1DE|nr:HAMP domain-containing sensor histidine kinase [Paracnuella aquatica]RPD50973.1 sensor histidine kinase [Paracnuella aquatica]